MTLNNLTFFPREAVLKDCLFSKNFEFDSIGSITVKGKKELVAIYSPSKNIS